MVRIIKYIWVTLNLVKSKTSSLEMVPKLEKILVSSKIAILLLEDIAFTTPRYFSDQLKRNTPWYVFAVLS